MESRTVPAFWRCYHSLPRGVRQAARKAYHLWRGAPFHPSLHFKCIDKEERIWSVRVTLHYRAVGFLGEDTVTWFWIGDHDDYERNF